MFFFMGFSKTLMTETAKTIACENNWLFHEYRSGDLFQEYITDKFASLKRQMEILVFESKSQGIPVVILFSQIDKLLTDLSEEIFLKKLKLDFFELFNSLRGSNNENENREHSQVIYIMTSDSPYKIKERYIQKISGKNFFFDYLTLQNFKISLAQIVSDYELKLSSTSELIDDDYDEEYDSGYSSSYDSDYYKKKKMRKARLKSRIKYPKHLNKTNIGESNLLNLRDFAKNSTFQNYSLRALRRVSFLELNSKRFYGDDYSFSNPYSGNYDNNKYEDEESAHFNCDVPENIPEIQIIAKDDLDIGIEKRAETIIGADLLATDNVIYIAGPHSCVKFDNEFHEFLKSSVIPNKDLATITFDKPGLIYEDIEQLSRIALHKYLYLKERDEEDQEDESKKKTRLKRMYNEEDTFPEREDEKEIDENIFTEYSFKGAILRYTPIISKEEGMNMLNWVYKFRKVQDHLGKIGSKLTEVFLPEKKKKQRKNSLMLNFKKKKQYPTEPEIDNCATDSLISKISNLREKLSSLPLQNNDEFTKNPNVVALDKSNLLNFISNLQMKIKDEEKSKFINKLQKVQSNLEGFRSSQTANNDQLSVLEKIAKTEEAVNNLKNPSSFDNNSVLEKLTDSVKKIRVSNDLQTYQNPKFNADENAIMNPDTNVLIPQFH